MAAVMSAAGSVFERWAMVVLRIRQVSARPLPTEPCDFPDVLPVRGPAVRSGGRSAEQMLDRPDDVLWSGRLGQEVAEAGAERGGLVFRAGVCRQCDRW